MKKSKKRKLQPFFGDKIAVYVSESHVKQIMRMATDGEFSELKTNVVFEDKNWHVAFDYKTNFGKGRILLQAQEIKNT